MEEGERGTFGFETSRSVAPVGRVTDENLCRVTLRRSGSGSMRHSVLSDSLRPHGLQPARLLCPWVLQTRIPEQVAIFSSRGSSCSRDQTCISCIGR